MESRLRTTRKELGFTQKQITELLGIPARTQQNWEGGVNKPAPWLEDMIIREYHRISNELKQDK